MTPSKQFRPALRHVALAAVLLCNAHTAFGASVNPTTGILNFGAAVPQSNNLKFEVGPTTGQVRVINNFNGAVQSFSGVRGINYAAGAGDDFLEFDINASRSLALSLIMGAGPANVKIQWKIPAGALSTASSLSMSSGGGDVNVELDFESETCTSTFGGTTNFGGGNKLLKS